MKKFVALGLAAALFVLTACGQKVSDPESLAYRLAGLDPEETILTVDGRDVPAEMYLYWMQYAATVAANTAGACSEEGELQWDHAFSDGVTVQEYVMNEALNQAKTYMIVEKWAEDYQVAFTQEDEDAVDEEIAYYAEQLGGAVDYETYLKQVGISSESNRRMTRDFHLYSKMQDMVKEEGSPLYIDQETLYQYDGITEDTILVDHILFFSSEDQENDRVRRETLEEVRQTLEEAEPDLRSDMFNYIADTYSEDTGRAYYPNGYLVTEDANFVQAFKDAALSLEEGELSEVVVSEYGYHLLLRKPIRDYVADAYLGDLLRVAIDNAEVVFTRAYEELDRPAYYSAYRAELEAAREALTGEGAAEGSQPEPDGEEDADAPAA